MVRGLVKVIRLSRINYPFALDQQKATVVATRTAKYPQVGSILVCEHEPVYTFGLRDTENYENSRSRLLETGAEVFKVGRGGLVTFHGPGQLVCYPILNLRLLKLGIKEYISKLEQSVVNVCSEMGVDCTRSCDPGVWVGNNKICAIGVQVTHGISWHGMAINCCVDLSYFQHINACGLSEKGTTSFTQLLGKSVKIGFVEQMLLPSLERTLQVQLTS